MSAAAKSGRKTAAASGDGEPATDARVPRTRVRAGTLTAALKDVVGMIGAGDTIPILADVLLTAGDGRITVTATNMDMWAVRELASNDAGEPDSGDWKHGIKPFTVALPGKALTKVIGGFDDDAMVEITAPDGDESRAVIKAGRSRFRLAALPAADFPVLVAREQAISFDMECAGLLDTIERVGFAMSTEATRYYLNGIFWHVWQAEGAAAQLRLVATDGHRLSRHGEAVPDGAMALNDMIVAAKTIAELRGLLRAAVKAAGDTPARVEITVAADGQWIAFDLAARDGGDVTLSAKLIDGRFPDYSRVIPTGNDRHATFERAGLTAAIKRLTTIAPDTSRAVQVELDRDRCTLSVSNAELGDAREELSCIYDSAPFVIGFNGVFWREALAQLGGDSVLMAFGDANGPVLIIDTDERGKLDDGRLAETQLAQVLMPYRV